jgi:histidyl-tRNA synthetase
LDDKEDGKKDFVKNAPKIDKFLTNQEKEDFKSITTYLNKMQINFIVDSTLVRGLDYYTNFIFEINSTDERLAGQPTIIGGGRYANLVKELGGGEYSCLGFALGIERLLLVLEYENIALPSSIEKPIDVVVANLNEKSHFLAFLILSILRSAGIPAVCKFDAYKLSKSFNYAETLKARFVIILGEKELKDEKVVIKNQKTLKQEVVEIKNIVSFIQNN